MSVINVKIANNVKVVVSDTLENLTSYVLLEKEDWFEDEISFVRNVVEDNYKVFDIGANHGVYTVSICENLKKGGHVWSFEPAKDPRNLLKQSVEINKFQDRITVVDCALSNRVGMAQMVVSAASEENSLRTEDRTGEFEEVRVSTLDAMWNDLGAPDIDFIKIDAEGEEANIIDGGLAFFSKTSPLVMFEVKERYSVNINLVQKFSEIGYGIYRLVPGIGVLVPFSESEEVDEYQINLFACKDDRAEVLNRRGFLSRQSTEAPLSHPLPDPRKLLSKLNFARGLAKSWQGTGGLTEKPLALYFASLETKRSPHERWWLIQQSLEALQAARSRNDHPAVRLTLLRVLRAIGKGGAAVSLLRSLAPEGAAAFTAALPEHPFLPSFPHWDDRPMLGGIEVWYRAVMADTLAQSLYFSTYIRQDAVPALWENRNNPNCTLAMYRQIFLTLLRANKKIPIKPESISGLLRSSNEHRNPELWKGFLQRLAAT